MKSEGWHTLGQRGEFCKESSSQNQFCAQSTANSYKHLNAKTIIEIIITHIHDNHIKFEVSLHFWQIWPTVWHPLKTSGLMKVRGGHPFRLMQIPKNANFV